MTNLKGLAGRDWNPGVSRRVPALMRDCRGPGASGAIMNGCGEASQEIVFENGENVVNRVWISGFGWGLSGPLPRFQE